MQIPCHHVDAFTADLFAGNPAAVCPLREWLPDPLLQAIAAENNLSETAFLVRGEGCHEIRWFTPTVEVSLCGHATLASAFALCEVEGVVATELRFRTRTKGDVLVRRRSDLYELDFPVTRLSSREADPDLLAALGIPSGRCFEAGEDLMVLLNTEADVRGLNPDMTRLARIPCRGVIVTARGESVDFVSRFFAPQSGIPEDPVTGSAHCALAPFWGDALGKVKLHARQVSRRGGELWCEVLRDRVLIAGRAVLYSTSTLHVG